MRKPPRPLRPQFGPFSILHNHVAAALRAFGERA